MEENQEKEHFSKYFPYKKIYKYLEDIELREKNINLELSFIAISRQTIKQLLKCSENKENAR